LRDTDLSVWKAYFDYPIDIAQGRGSVRAWLDLDHAKVANFTADLHLSDLSARLGKGLEPLQLKQVNGRVSASEAMGATPQRRRTHIWGQRPCRDADRLFAANR